MRRSAVAGKRFSIQPKGQPLTFANCLKETEGVDHVVNAAMFMKMMWKAGVSIERQQARVRAGLHVRAGGGWRLGLLVARSCEKDKGHGVSTGNSETSDFADKIRLSLGEAAAASATRR